MGVSGLGLYGPLVCYQTMTGRTATDAKNLVALQDLASFLEEKREGLGDKTFGNDFIGNRSGYLHRDTSGEIRVLRERWALFRPTLRDVISKSSSQRLAVVVPDIEKLLDCDIFVAAAIAYLNSRMVLQIFSMKNPQTGRDKVSRALTKEGLAVMRDGEEIYHYLTGNSDACKTISEKVLASAINSKPTVKTIAEFDWNAPVSVVVPRLQAEWERVCGPELLVEPKFI
tara:strand:+ start:4109 stop:4792 length:684 start_codon:yes stop_codon:yes gene_type:complete